MARACTVSILPDALLMRQLMVLAWSRVHRVGGLSGGPCCSTTAATGCREPPTDHPVCFQPKTHFLLATTMPGEKHNGP